MKISLYKKLLLSLMLSFLLSSCAQARWATYQDAVSEVENYDHFIKVNKNGSTQEIVEKQEKILKESGVEELKTFTLVYNSSFQTAKILSAKTIVDGTEYLVDIKKIEDKPLASSNEGFVEKRQIMIAFPKLDVGAQIFIKYKITSKPIALKKYFSTEIVSFDDKYFSNFNFTIDSDIKLFLETNNPKNYFTVNKKDKKNGGTNISITNAMPFIEYAIDDLDYIRDEQVSFFAVSSINNWQDFSKQFGTKYDRVVKQDLPLLFKQIVDTADKTQSEVDIINHVTSALATKIKYMGDWSSVNDLLFPHSLSKIAELGFADCKDYSVATVAMLNALGFSATPALVYRGAGSVSVGYKLPMVEHFNHAIVYATKNGKDYWIDPTNFFSMAGGIFPDIANKEALLLGANELNPYKRVPQIDFERNKIVINRTVELIDDENLLDYGNLALYGEMALSFTGSELFYSKESIEKLILSAISDASLRLEKKFVLPSMASRVVGDLEFGFELKHKHSFVLTNLGKGLKLPPYQDINLYLQTNPSLVSDLYVGMPRTIKSTITIKNFSAELNGNNLDFTISSPWLDVTRKLYRTDETIIIEDSYILKQDFISNEDIHSNEFYDLQQKIREKLLMVAIISAL